MGYLYIRCIGEAGREERERGRKREGMEGEGDERWKGKGEKGGCMKMDG